MTKYREEEIRRSALLTHGLDPDKDYEAEEAVTPEVSVTTQVVEAPSESDVRAQTDKLLAQVMRAGDNSTAIIEEAGLDASKLENLTVDQWTVEAERQFSKGVKTESITEAAAVSAPGGAVPGVTTESLTAELADLHAGKHGSLSSFKNQKRMREISEKMNRISPPEITGRV